MSLHKERCDDVQCKPIKGRICDSFAFAVVVI